MVAPARDSIRIQVRGGASLSRKLNALANTEMKKIIRKALRSGAKVILPVARANAPVGATGNLRKSIKIRAAKRSRRYVALNVTLGKRFFVGDEFYGAFQEFGWKTGKRGSVKRRAVAGKHFLQRAADTKGKAAGDVVVRTAWDLLKVRAGVRLGPFSILPGA